VAICILIAIFVALFVAFTHPSNHHANLTGTSDIYLQANMCLPLWCTAFVRTALVSSFKQEVFDHRLSLFMASVFCRKYCRITALACRLA